MAAFSKKCFLNLHKQFNNVSRQKLFYPSISYCKFQLSNFTTAESTTSDQSELAKFSALHSDWWDENGPFKALHSMNRVRIPWIRDTLSANLDTSGVDLPLKNKRILDVGCGGGILSEPLAKLGAKVTGLETVAEGVEVAKAHLHKLKSTGKQYSNLHIEYLNSTIEDYVSNNTNIKFDAIVASEVIEHVADRRLFLANCEKLLPTGGHIFLTTLNRTWASRIFAIFVAENILGIVPKGIHDWDKFVSPDDLELCLERLNFHVKLVHGLCYNPLNNGWSWIGDTSINYAMCAVKC